MKNWLSHLFRSQSSSTGAAVNTTVADQAERVLTLEKEAQSLRMELDARERSLINLKQELERLRTRQGQVVAETVAAQMEGLFSDLAGPASQILTQADLLENQSKPVQARDVLSVARRMARAAERHGLVFEGKIGEPAVFDPNRHTPINNSAALEPGQAVTVRFVGASYQGKVIYKAVVE